MHRCTYVVLPADKDNSITIYVAIHYNVLVTNNAK